MIPDHTWLPWKFKCVPMSFWCHIGSHVMYFEWLCHKLNLMSPHAFYSLSQIAIFTNYGKGLLDQYYNNSPENLVKQLHPELVWINWEFKHNAKWNSTESHKKYFEWIGEKMGFTEPHHYTSLTFSQVQRLNGASLLLKYYNGRVDEFVHMQLKQSEMSFEKQNVSQNLMGDTLDFLFPNYCVTTLFVSSLR